MQNKLIKAVGGSLLLGLSAAPALAQVPLTPRALGMGGAFAAVARGNETVFLNPANLGLSGTPHWSIAMAQFGLGGTMLGMTTGDLPDIQNYDDASEARRAEILSAIPESGAEIRYDARLPFLAFQNGHFALGVSFGSTGQHTIGKDLAELIFTGYEEGRTDYSVGDTRGSRISFLDFAAAYGRKVGPVSVGLTGHYIHGRTVLQSRLFEPRIDVDRQDIEIDYLAVYSKGGRGYGLDAGIAMEPTRSITLSAAVSNLYSKMEWSDELYTRSLQMDRADFDSQEPVRLLERYQASEQKVDPNGAPLEVYQTAEGLFDDAYFPAIARLGAAWKGSHGTDVAVGFQNKLSEGRMGDQWDRMASAGIQQKLPLITVRAGYATNLDGGSMVTGGLSLGPMELGLAKLSDGGPGGALRSGYIATFGVGVRTPGVRE